jgi:hypothetical protein
MSAKKTIQVNKSFLELSNNRSVKTDKQIKPKRTKTLASPNKMKREFLKKIKDFQNKRAEALKTSSVIEKTPDENEFEEEFSKSLMFLQNIATIRSTKKQPILNTSNEISVALPTSFDDSNDVAVPIKTYRNTIKLPPRPLYSCLKNSSRPTYRTWINSKKKQMSVKMSPIIINDMPVPENTERSHKLLAYKKEIKQVPVKTMKITKTIKRKLGKIGNTVGILIKSRQTRRNIQCEQAKINQTSIHDIKKYLRDKNMIKTCSNSPNDVLRKLYEQCILAGDITNNSENIMLHNYINDKTIES